MVKWIALSLFAAAGCALFSEGPPDNFCRGDADCFRAQGEVCNLDTKTCELGDGGVPVPDSAVDAGVDAVDAASE